MCVFFGISLFETWLTFFKSNLVRAAYQFWYSDSLSVIIFCMKDHQWRVLVNHTFGKFRCIWMTSFDYWYLYLLYWNIFEPSLSESERTMQTGKRFGKLMTSHCRHSVPNHQELDCLFKSLYWLTAEKTPAFLAVCDWKPPVTVGFTSQRVSSAVRVSMPLCNHMLISYGKRYLVPIDISIMKTAIWDVFCDLPLC